MSDTSNSFIDVPDYLRFIDLLPDEFTDDMREKIEFAARSQHAINDETSQPPGAEHPQEQRDGYDGNHDDDDTRPAIPLADMFDLPGAHSPPTIAKSKSKEVKMMSGLVKGDGLYFGVPSQKIREKIRNNDYVDLWHLTVEGMAAAARSKVRGATTLTCNATGEITLKEKEDLHGFTHDIDLSHDAWTFALTQYVRTMRLEGVADNIVAAMERVNRVMSDHPDRPHHPRAIRLWHQEHRRHWTLSGTTNEHGMRYDLGIPSKEDFRDCCRRVADDEFAAATRQLGGVKRPAAEDQFRATKSKLARSTFRCFVCWSTDAKHDIRGCKATSRVDGKNQHVIRGSDGKAVFADNRKPVCYNFQQKGALARPDVIASIIAKEHDAGRYHGPFSRSALSSLLGCFQNSPLGLVPKGVNDWRPIQDFSWPRDGGSINSFLCSDDWPTTWGSARDVVRLLLALPPSTCGAVRDVANAFRLVPIHPSQWHGTVVRGPDDSFYIDTCLGFGLAPATGIWGMVADALGDICRASGTGPLLKWVDDFLFLTVPLHDLESANDSLAILASSMSDRQSRGGVAFFQASDGSEHCTDYKFSIQNLAASLPSDLVTSLAAVDSITAPLGIPWKPAKDTDFGPCPIYIGFQWFISAREVALSPAKQEKYLQSVQSWLQSPTHTLEEAQTLFGRLQHATFVVRQGRKRLGSLRRFIAVMQHLSPWASHHAGPQIEQDMRWWRTLLERPILRRNFASDGAIDPVYVACDASTSYGIGIFLDGAELSLPLRAGWATHGRGIAWLEAVAIEISLLTLISRGFQDCRIQIYTDNASVYFSEQNGHSRNAEIMATLGRIRELEAAHNIELLPILVPSAHNVADEPSRGIRTTDNRLACPLLPDVLRRHFR